MLGVGYAAVDALREAGLGNRPMSGPERAEIERVVLLWSTLNASFPFALPDRAGFRRIERNDAQRALLI